MGLGSLHKVSLADARKEADRCRKLAHEGRDPIEIRDAEREARKVVETTSKTFKAWATTYMAEHERNGATLNTGTSGAIRSAITHTR